jgi:hypothetical protein
VWLLFVLCFICLLKISGDGGDSEGLGEIPSHLKSL